MNYISLLFKIWSLFLIIDRKVIKESDYEIDSYYVFSDFSFLKFLHTTKSINRISKLKEKTNNILAKSI